MPREGEDGGGRPGDDGNDWLWRRRRGPSELASARRLELCRGQPQRRMVFRVVGSGCGGGGGCPPRPPLRNSPDDVLDPHQRMKSASSRSDGLSSRLIVKSAALLLPMIRGLKGARSASQIIPRLYRYSAAGAGLRRTGGLRRRFGLLSIPSLPRLATSSSRPASSAAWNRCHQNASSLSAPPSAAARFANV